MQNRIIRNRIGFMSPRMPGTGFGLTSGLWMVYIRPRLK
jgi:hypothetical protein